MKETFVLSKEAGESYVKTKGLSLLSIALFWFVFDQDWIGWFFRETIFSSGAPIYTSFVIVFVTFVLLLYNNESHIKEISIVWLPYIIITFFGLMIGLKFQGMIYWFAFLVMLLIAARSDILRDVPVKLIFWSGIVATIGVYIQFLFYPFYVTHIDYIFIYADKKDVTDISDALGMYGFTYQQGTTSTLIMYGLCALLYLKEIVLPKFLQKKYIYWILIILMIVAIFLTGKKMMSVISIIVPITVLFLYSQKGFNRVLLAIFIAVFIVISYQYIFPLLIDSTDIFVFKRLGSMIDAANAGSSLDDISSGRSYLAQKALKIWEQHPIFGIGVRNFIEYARTDTDVHNTYLQVLCEQGIIGFALYIIPIVFSLIKTIQLNDKLSAKDYMPYIRLSLSFQLVYILYALTGNVNIDASIVMYFIAISLVIRVNYIVSAYARKRK